MAAKKKQVERAAQPEITAYKGFTNGWTCAGGNKPDVFYTLNESGEFIEAAE